MAMKTDCELDEHCARNLYIRCRMYAEAQTWFSNVFDMSY